MKKNTASLLAAIVFSIIILAGCLLNAGSFKDDLLKLFSGRTSLYSMSQRVPEQFRSNLSFKESFVELNGLFAAVTGKRVNNQVMKLSNGSLVEERVPSQDMSERAEQIIGLKNYLAGLDIPFLYVQTPDKVDLQDTLLPEGSEYCANGNASSLVDNLTAGGVECFDLRNAMSAVPQQTEAYFYRTDHHWNAQGALKASELVSRKIDSVCNADQNTASLLSEDAWKLYTREKSFLGSRGKRVGRFFAGVDDLQWLEPLFETDMTTIIPASGEIRTGTFAESKIVREIIDKDQDLFSDNPYTLYLGDVYGLVEHRNKNAVSDLKVLLVGDSFMLPLQCFLATEYSEVDAIDLRYYQLDSIDISYSCAETLAQYIANNRPDIVVMMVSPTMITDERFYHFGLNDDRVNPDDEAAQLRLVYAPVQADDQYEEVCSSQNRIISDTCVLDASLDKGGHYQIQFSGVDPEAEYVLVKVMDDANEGPRVASMVEISAGQGSASFYTPMRSEIGKMTISVTAYNEKGETISAEAGRITLARLYSKADQEEK